MISGGLIQNQLTDITVSVIYVSANYLRYIGCAFAILGSWIGLFAAKAEKRTSLALAVYCQILVLPVMLTVVGLDTNNAVSLSINVQNGKTVKNYTGTLTSYSDSYIRACCAAFFGFFTLGFAALTMWLGWCHYLEHGDAPSNVEAAKGSIYLDPVKQEQKMATKLATIKAGGGGTGWAQTKTKTATTLAPPKENKPKEEKPKKDDKPKNIDKSKQNRLSKAVPSALTGPVVCTQCKTEWPDPVKFCGECGGSVVSKSAKTPGPEWERFETDDGEVYYYNAATDESKWPDEF